jgi:hypothetical protein
MRGSVSTPIDESSRIGNLIDNSIEAAYLHGAPSQVGAYHISRTFGDNMRVRSEAPGREADIVFNSPQLARLFLREQMNLPPAGGNVQYHENDVTPGEEQVEPDSIASTPAEAD